MKNSVRDEIKLTGIPSMDELKASPGLVNGERFEKGPVAVIECVQEIPCNPCEAACPFDAIFVGSPISNLPVINGEKCTGCGTCLASCPGLAIFLVEKNYTDFSCLIEFPYEYLPFPKEGDIVPCGGRDGQFIIEGKVVRVRKNKQLDGTTLVSVEVPKKYYMDIRTICRKRDSV